MSNAHLLPSSEVPSHRACDFCRSQKVRCMLDESSPDVCERCARLGRACVFTPLQKRKQRKRTDTRVAELEREMRLMQSMLHNKSKERSNEAKTTTSTSVLDRPSGLAQGEDALGATNVGVENSLVRSNNGSVQQQPPSNSRIENFASVSRPARGVDRSLNESNATTRDVIDRDIISMATARQFFEIYRKELFPHYPMVPISDSISADEMRRSKPVLFLAAIAAAAGKDNPDISAVLDQEILQTYATNSLVRSQKSLEMVQSLLISAVWYYPPSRFGQLKYYEYIHMAATIAMDIGIGTRSTPHRSRFGSRSGVQVSGVHPLEDATNPDLSMTPRSRNASPDTSSIDSRRTFISCYAICAQCSISLRRPNMLRMTSYLRECVDYLDRSPDALPSDKMLVAWIRLVMIKEDISTAFSYDDPADVASITEMRTQLMLKDFNKKLEDWYASTPEATKENTLNIVYWSCHLYLNEVALHVDHSPEDFKAPYQMGIVHPWDGDDIPTQILAESVAACVSCAHNLMNTFLEIGVESLRTLPVLTYVRVSYAAFILAKLCLSASHPESHIGRVLDHKSVDAESILDRAILHVRNGVGAARCRVPAIFVALLFKLRQWCLHPELIETPPDSFLELGMRNAADGSRKAGESQLTPSTDDARLLGPGSTDDSSPQISSDGHASPRETLEATAQDLSETGWTKPSMPHEGLDFAANALNSEAPTLLLNDTLPQVTGFLNPNDQMELDQSFFNFFGGLHGSGEHDLAFLDDWASLPTDMLGLSSGVNSQNTIPGNDFTRL